MGKQFKVTNYIQHENHVVLVVAQTDEGERYSVNVSPVMIDLCGAWGHYHTMDYTLEIDEHYQTRQVYGIWPEAEKPALLMIAVSRWVENNLDKLPWLSGNYQAKENNDNGDLYDDDGNLIKHRSNKLRWSLLPWEAVAQVVDILEYGARKYSKDSWKRVPEEDYNEALLRHVIAFFSGETHDKESGRHHLAHAACNCLFILWFNRGDNG